MESSVASGTRTKFLFKALAVLGGLGSEPPTVSELMAKGLSRASAYRWARALKDIRKETVMGTVVELSVPTTGELPPDKVLEAAVGKLDRVVISGITKDGEEYFAASHGSSGEALWMMERFRMRLLRDDEDH